MEGSGVEKVELAVLAVEEALEKESKAKREMKRV